MKRFLYPLIMLSGAAIAVERPDRVSPPKQDQSVSTSTSVETNATELAPQKLPSVRPENSTAETSSQPAALKVAWLGVAGDPVNEELSYHLNINAGLITRIVSPQGPAHQAGLRPNDIIETVNEQKVYTQEDLRKILSSYEPESSITLGIVSRGEHKLVPVTLVQRPTQVINTPPAPPESDGILKNLLEMANPSEKTPGGKRRSFGQILDGMGINRLLKEAAPTQNFNLNFQSQSAIKMVDEKGSVEVQSVEDGTHIVVRGVDGAVQYEGPWNTTEDRAMASPEIQKRISDLNFQHKSLNLHLPPHATR